MEPKTKTSSGAKAEMARIADLGGRLADRLAVRLRHDPPDLWFTYHLYHKAPDWLGPAVSAALVSAGGTTSANRPSISCSSKWMALRQAQA